MKKKYIIYLHKNKINGKCYVGQTCQKPEARWGAQGHGYKEQQYFYRAILKYGWENFEHFILEENISEDKVDEREAFWAGYYHALAPEGYTLRVGSQNHIQDSKKMWEIRSQASKKNWQNPEYRKKISQKRKEEWENPKIREICLKNLDWTGKSGAKHPQSKKVQCIETGLIYGSMREAERMTGICYNNISQVCSGQRKTAGGFHWKIIKESEVNNEDTN